MSAFRKFLMLLVVCSLTACDRREAYDKIVALRDRVEARPRDSEALTKLVAYLADDHWHNPSTAAGCLRQLAEGPANKTRIVPIIAPVAVPALVAHAEHVGRAATSALSEYGDYVLPYKKELAAIIRRHPTEDIAWFAAETLGNFGPQAKDELPAIEAIPIFEGNRELIHDAIRKISSPQRPNQSPEPTAMSVTPPAAQESRQP